MKMAFAPLKGVYRVLVLGGRSRLRQGHGATNTAALQRGLAHLVLWATRCKRYVSAKWQDQTIQTGATESEWRSRGEPLIEYPA
jgi:hypothetical protein